MERQFCSAKKKSWVETSRLNVVGLSGRRNQMSCVWTVQRQLVWWAEGGVRVSRSGEESSSAGAAGRRVQHSVCEFLLADHPLRPHPCPVLFYLPPSCLSCQSGCRRCLCLRVRIWYLEPQTPSSAPSLLLLTPAGSNVCLSSLLPPTDHNIHYCILYNSYNSVKTLCIV